MLRSVGFFAFLSALSLVTLLTEVHSASPETEMRHILGGTRWIAYAPTHYFPAESPPVTPSVASLTADLELLRGAGFDGLITYGADIDGLPDVASRLGFRRLIVGIWDPSSARERAYVMKAVMEHGGLIAGVIVGNEGILTGRYSLDMLCSAMAQIGRATGKPVSTTEPVDWILSEPRLAGCSGFITVNAHPYFSNRRLPADAVQWTVEAWDAIRKRYPGKPLLFKEVGLPTAGDRLLSEEGQKAYYVQLSRTQVVFTYFEAFDATARFKNGLVEQSWGLWRADRTPKALVSALPWRSVRK
jgi:exo-beta-1,3-glucanase (GH17 family)